MIDENGKSVQQLSLAAMIVTPLNQHPQLFTCMITSDQMLTAHLHEFQVHLLQLPYLIHSPNLFSLSFMS